MFIVLIGAECTGTMTIGGGLPALTSTSGTTDGFIIKLNPTGTPTWRTSVSGPGYQDLFGISVQADGSFYVAVSDGSNEWGALKCPLTEA